MHYTLNHFLEPQQPRYKESILYVDLQIDTVYQIGGADRHNSAVPPTDIRNDWITVRCLDLYIPVQMTSNSYYILVTGILRHTRTVY